MNRRIDDRKCEVCGSTKRVEGQTHYICDGCGSQLEELEPDPGFVPEGQTPTVLRDSGDRNQLGSRIDPSGDKASEKFRKKHMVASYQKPRFIDIIVRELVKKCGTGNSSQDAARLLIEVDSKERLGAVRKKRRGAKGPTPGFSPRTLNPNRAYFGWVGGTQRTHRGDSGSLEPSPASQENPKP